MSISIKTRPRINEFYFCTSCGIQQYARDDYPKLIKCPGCGNESFGTLWKQMPDYIIHNVKMYTRVDLLKLSMKELRVIGNLCGVKDNNKAELIEEIFKLWTPNLP